MFKIFVKVVCPDDTKFNFIYLFIYFFPVLQPQWVKTTVGYCGFKFKAKATLTNCGFIHSKKKKSRVNEHMIAKIRLVNILEGDLLWLFFLQKDYFSLKL